MDGRHVIGFRPAPRDVLAPIVEFAGQESLELHGAVEEIKIADLIEIVRADVRRQIGAPMVGHPLEGQGRSRVHVGDAIGARAERRLQRGRGDVARIAVRVGSRPPVSRHHQQLADDMRQFLVAGPVEGEADRARIERLGRRHMLIVEPQGGIVVDLGIERPDHIVGRDRFAVMPARALAQAIFDPGVIVRIAQRLGQKAVHRRNLVHGRGHQRLVDQSQPGGGLAARQDGVERIERAGGRKAQRAALGRLGVHIVEMGETGGVFRFSDECGRVQPLRFCGLPGVGIGRQCPPPERRKRDHEGENHGETESNCHWPASTDAASEPTGRQSPAIVRPVDQSRGICGDSKPQTACGPAETGPKTLNSASYGRYSVAVVPPSAAASAAGTGAGSGVGSGTGMSCWVASQAIRSARSPSRRRPAKLIEVPSI